MKRFVPPRYEKQKMVVVDFSNPFLRDYFPKWLANHQAQLDRVRAELPKWAEEAREQEAAEAKRENRSARPLVVVFDIDEVLLCNTHLNGYRSPAGASAQGASIDFHAADFFVDSATGEKWGRNDPGDPPLPGAVALLEQVAALKLKPYFITGRLESIRDITKEDFRRAGFHGEGMPLVSLDEDTLIMVPDGEYPKPGESIRPFKEGKRAEINETHRIVMNIGDQASDLGLYGDRQVYLPHPFYTTY